MESKFINRYRTFCKCLNNLKRAKSEDPNKAFVLEGVVQTFNLTFDISWKVMKDILVKVLEITDFALGSPRQVLQAAYTNGLISDDEWLLMLKTRNQLAHDYDGEFALRVYQNIIEQYIPLLDKFRLAAEQYYKEESAEKDTFRK